MRVLKGIAGGGPSTGRHGLRRQSSIVDVRAWSWAALVGAVTCCGCQAMFPALPGGLAWNEKARIEKKAKGDSFPSPADVGLTEPTPTP